MKNEPRTPLAFPQDCKNMHYFGLTMRDYFAAKAMQGLVSRDSHNVYDDEKMSLRSYKIADAMLKERDRNND